MKSYSDFKSKQFEKLIRNLERCQRQINYIKKVDKHVYKGLVGGSSGTTSTQGQTNTSVKQQGQSDTPVKPVKQQGQSDTPVKPVKSETAATAESAVEAGLNYSVGDIIKSNTGAVTYIILNDKDTNNDKQNVLELKTSAYNNENEQEEDVTVLNTNFSKLGNISNVTNEISEKQIEFYRSWYNGDEGLRLRADSGEEGLLLQNTPVNTDDEIAALLGEIDDPELVKEEELKEIDEFDFSSLDTLAVRIKGLLEAARNTAAGNETVLEDKISKLEDIKNKLRTKILDMKANKETANENYFKLKDRYTKVRNQLLAANNNLASINTSFSSIN